MRIKSKTELLFVQLGNKKATHLVKNIHLIKDLLPQIDINCVVSENSYLSKNLPLGVNIFIYKPTKEINALFEGKKLDIKFRNGFWRYTLERLLAINMVHNLRPNTSQIHIESDVLLLPGFPMSYFSKLEKISWLESSDNSDIASIIYFPNQNLTENFANHILIYIRDNSSPTDMHALYCLRKKYPTIYGLLPSKNENFPKLEMRNSDLSNQEVPLNGIFDAASIGMWLTGIDPRNSYGITRYFSTVQLSSSKFFIKPQVYPLNFVHGEGLYFIDGPNKLQIYSLHIHSKSRSIFSNKPYEEIEKLVRLSHKNRVRTRFKPQILVQLIVDNFLNGTLLEFIYNSPALSPLRHLRKHC
jgi:hypothetical protein